MNIHLDTHDIVTLLILIITAIAITEAICNRLKYKKEKSKYTQLRKHYSKVYNQLASETKNQEHEFHSVKLQYLNQDCNDEYYQWYLTEEDMLETINKHNEIAYQVREKLDKLGLDHSNKHMFDRHSNELKESLDKSEKEQHDVSEKSMAERANWYKQTDIIAEELSLKNGSYGYNDLPYPINIKELKNRYDIDTRTVKISKEGIQKLLNKVAYN